MFPKTLRAICELLAVSLFVLFMAVGEAHALVDTDGDGIANPIDNCPSVANPGQEDSNNDGIGDACAGPDGDGLSDPFDNCPTVYNPDQANTFGDSRGDACEAESGKRLNGIANKIVVYEIVETQEIQFYSASGKKLGSLTKAALIALAAGGAGASQQVTADGKVAVTYVGNSDFTVTNNLTAAGDTATFHLEGVTTITGTSTPSPTAVTSARIYTVMTGDTLSRIARKFGVTVSTLVSANNLKDPNFLRVGQKLIIP